MPCRTRSSRDEESTPLGVFGRYDLVMAWRLPPAAAPTSLGATWPILGAVFAAFYVLTAFLAQLLMSRIPLDEAAWVDERLNLALVGVLGAAALAWSLAAARGRVTAASGAGLLLAGYGLATRIYAEFLMWMLGWPLPEWLGHTGVHTWARLVRLGGLAAFVFGITCTIAGVALERRWTSGPARDT
mgnify:CR=1 FL=1